MASNKLPGQDALLSAIEHTPIIDHHAHALLRAEATGAFPLLSIASEASDALEASRTGLAHFRAVKQLSAALACEPTWDAVEAAIARKHTESHREWTAQCLAGIECVLVDDGLASEGEEEEMTPWNHLDAFTPSACKRIVRIETVAEQLIARHCLGSSTPSPTPDAFNAVTDAFKTEIERAIRDPNVAGFKSVICYRSGLAIAASPVAVAAGAKAAFDELYVLLRVPVADNNNNSSSSSSRAPIVRLDHPGLNEYFVHIVAGLIAQARGELKKPLQFHTGLGDNDIVLANASPALLHPFIRAYPSVPFVLLHAGYPFVRETGYLASEAPNVYADIGEIFPVISRDGQESALRQILEICPSSKILWSTDGHFVPETYFLAVKQMRQALRAVLTEYVAKGDLTSQQGVQLVQDILFNNANMLYGLGLTMKHHHHHHEPSSTPSAAVVVGRLPRAASSPSENLRLLSEYVSGRDEAPKFLSMWWNDVMSAGRMRSVPMRRVWSMLSSGQDLSFGLATAYSGLLLNETLVAGATAIGEHRLIPDFTTLRPGFRDGHLLVMSRVTEQDGSPMPLCPRSILKRTLDEAAGHGLTFDLGFEMELLFARRTDAGYEGLGFPGHSASNVRAFEHTKIVDVLEEAIEKLEKAGIFIEMVHAESAPGQYEVILPRAPALAAVENLVYARDVISACAASRGLRMTLHPKPFAMACGTASHCHMSISSPGGDLPAVYESFYAGILKHLRAIVAFTYSSLASYERAQDGCWAGGTWVTYGSMNREAPFRKVHLSHWEMKCMDGLANPYLALAAVLAAGTHGVVDREELTWADCTMDPAQLSEQKREVLGIRERIPRSLQEALGALEEDKDMKNWMGGELVERYLAVKRSEGEFLGAMAAGDRKTWIMDRF
ncbi:Protein fluG [Escovopsis weberi]|uniref:Protein fluG n=1 Tax=Escovopsis weberi TaxID=150374 RepID=A0A0M8MX57_ESCWE|nr:Protein fluG [Escovopsis weberi]